MAENVFVVQNPSGQFEADCCDERCGFGMHCLVESDSKQEAEQAAKKHRGELRKMGEPERIRDREIDRLRAERDELKAELERQEIALEGAGQHIGDALRRLEDLKAAIEELCVDAEKTADMVDPDGERIQFASVAVRDIRRRIAALDTPSTTESPESEEN